MSLTLKPGLRLFSAVDSTEMIVIRAPQDPVELTIGGVPPVLAAANRRDGTPARGHDSGVALGKRYVDSDGRIELLATKAGDAVPALDDRLFSVKEAKPLPASD